MSRKDQIALYGCVGLVVAAFAFVAGIVAAPLLPLIWSPDQIIAQR